MSDEIKVLYYTKNHGFTLEKYNDDSVEITRDEWEDLLTKQSNGMVIESNANGRPIAVPVTYTDEDKIISNRNKKAALLSDAKEQIELLTDVAEVTKDEKYINKLKEWTNYRVAVYLLDTNILDLVWPEQPAE